MRPRLIKPQIVTVRPVKAVAGDRMGDASLLTSKLRDPPITGVRMQVSHTSGIVRVGGPGKDQDLRAIAMVIDKWGWTPRINDLIELASGVKLFVADVQPAWPKDISLTSPSGGFYGWRLNLVSRSPEVNPATRYD